MKYILPLLFILTFYSFGQKELTLDSLLNDLSQLNSSYQLDGLQEMYPNVVCSGGLAILDTSASNAVKNALKRRKTGLFGPILNSDGSNSYIKVFENSKDYLMRMNYILLGKGAEAKQITDSLFNLINSGSSFSDIAFQNTRDPSREKLGDYGWFKKNYMVKPIDEEFSKHGLNDVFKAYTSEYGWIIVKVKAKLKKRRFVDYIEVVILE